MEPWHYYISYDYNCVVDIYVCCVSYTQAIASKGFFLALVATTVETANPEAELRPGLDLLGPVLEKYVGFYFCNRVRPHPGKFWNLLIRIPGLKSTGISSKVIKNLPNGVVENGVPNNPPYGLVVNAVPNNPPDGVVVTVVPNNPPDEVVTF